MVSAGIITCTDHCERDSLDNGQPDPATESKVAIVTGAAQRIGAAIARRLHHSGYNVLVHYRSDDKPAKALVDELNQIRADSAIAMKAELTQDRSPEDVVAASIEQWGRLDLLVNNASEFFATPIGNISANDMQKIFGSNVQAPLLLSQAAYPHLKNTDGSIVNILDVYATVVHKDHPVYCASKAALSMLTKSLAVELAPAVRVNGISPGAILWPDGNAAIDDAKKKEVLQHVPLEIMGAPVQIADAVVYLAGSSASFITGQILAIDGGRSL